MKKVLILLFLGILVTSCSRKTHNLEWIPFTWTSVSLEGRNIEKAAMNISVSIDDISHNKFIMQFDLGAVLTVFYEKALNPFLYDSPLLNTKLDTTKTFWYNGQPNNPYFNNVNLSLGDVVFESIKVGLYKNYGTEISRDSISPETEIRIGTIGADLVQNKVLIIDYKLSRLAIADTLPAEYQNISFEDFIIDNRRIKIPFQINGKKEHLMFDTGASIFTLTTSKQNALSIGGSEIVDSLTVTSWGEYVTFYGLKTVFPIMFGDKDMGSSIVYYSEDTSWDDFYKSENMWGLTGNAFFFNDVVIIDYKNNRFGVQ